MEKSTLMMLIGLVCVVLQVVAISTSQWSVLKMGAGKTPTVHNLLVSAGVLNDKKIAVHKQPKKKERFLKMQLLAHG